MTSPKEKGRAAIYSPGSRSLIRFTLTQRRQSFDHRRRLVLPDHRQLIYTLPKMDVA